MRFWEKGVWIGCMCLSFFLPLIGEEISNRSDYSDRSVDNSAFSDISSSPVSDAVQGSHKTNSLHHFSGFVSFVSDYRFRGISLTMRQPAIQGGLDYLHKSGLYAGIFGSNIDGTTHLFNNTSMELDVFGGYKGKLFPLCSHLSDWEYNFGFILYYYPGGKTYEKHSVSYNTVEYFIELSYKKFSLKYWQTVTNIAGISSNNPPFNWHKDRLARPNGNSIGSIYLEANHSWDFSENWHLLAHVGYQFYQNYWYLNYLDWRATLTRDFKWFNVFLTYIGTNANKDYFDVPNHAFHQRKKSLGTQGLVVGIVKAF